MFSTPSNSQSNARGFTVVEVILALVLSTLVVGGVVSLFGMIQRIDQKQKERFDQTADLAIAQIVLRQAMMTLVAESPPNERSRNRPNTDREEDLALPPPPDEKLRQELIETLLRDLQEPDQSELIPDLEPELADALIGELMALEDSGLPHFELFYEDVGGPTPAPRVEVVVMNSPVPVQSEGHDGYDPESDEMTEEELMLRGHLAQLKEQSRGVIRGSFEIMYYEDGPALQWRPVDPPGRPFVLIRGIERIEWWLLPHYDEERDGWVDDAMSAHQKEDFPLAIRLLVWLTDGRHIDWMFETDTVAGP